MFGRSKPVVIDRYASRSRTTVPRWLWLLLLGAVLGAGTVVYVQEKHLPPRLSPAESGRLQTALATAEAERSRLGAALSQAQTQLQAAQADQQRAAAELAGSVRERAGLRNSIDALLSALPADPRGSEVEVRSGRFKVEGPQLGFDVVLSRARGEAAPFTGVLQFTVSGTTGRGAEATVDLEPVAVTVGRFEIASGAVPMPAGFTPREATLRVLDRAGGRPMGMRVFYVR
jgi:hypothetical protein